MSKEHNHGAPKPRRDWTRIHHSPLFWAGFVLFLVAIAVYVLTENLSWRPHVHHHAGAQSLSE
ncbi:MAG TPA: hypothetical protein VMD53_16625 [Rhizomicrobium sp.]|nr:hypothetical protein [Rhizomicrobium sp.]